MAKFTIDIPGDLIPVLKNECMGAGVKWQRYLEEVAILHLRACDIRAKVQGRNEVPGSKRKLEK